MITLPSAVSAAINSGSLWVVNLINFQAGSTTYYITDHYRNIVYSSNTYLANGRLLTIDSVKQSTSSLHSTISLSLSAINSTFRLDVLDADVIGGEVEIYRGFVSSTTGDLLADPTLLYSGIVHSTGQVDDRDANTFTAALDVRASSYRLTGTPGRFTEPSSTQNMVTNISNAGVITRNSSDTSFNQIALLDGVSIRFGAET